MAVKALARGGGELRLSDGRSIISLLPEEMEFFRLTFMIADTDEDEVRAAGARLPLSLFPLRRR